MAKTKDFTSGPVARQIVGLALPIMGTAFLQMAYNLADLFWIGHEGSIEAAAVGCGGIFMWLGTALTFMMRTGAEITISQSIGRGYPQLAQRYARQTLALALAVGVTYGLLLLLLRRPLIGLYALNDARTYQYATAYLGIVGGGMVFTFINAAYFGLYNGHGNSRIPFIANGVGLSLNLILDPLMIRGLGPFPAMGVAGAAYATVISQGVVTLTFLAANLRAGSDFHRVMRGYRPSLTLTAQVVRLGGPVAVQNALFACIALIVARLAARWGDLGIAVLSVGSQIEAISWMTAGGFASALGSFVGQNWGAQRLERIREGYRKTLAITLSMGALATVLFTLWGEPIFGLIVPEATAMHEGGIYLRILGVSQLFMVLEIVSSGAFNGIGRTTIPAVVSIAFNLLRIPLALWWGAYALSGVWWSITSSSILKGSILFAWLILGSGIWRTCHRALGRSHVSTTKRFTL